MSATALRASATRARAASSDRYDCSATFCAIWYCWRAASTCVRAGRTRSARRPSVRAASRSARTPPRRGRAPPCAFITSGTRVGSNGWPGVSPRRASICAALASASCSCADVSAGEMRDEHRALRDARAALDRRLDDAAGGLGAHLGLFVGEQRAGDAQITIDRPAFDRRRRRRRAAPASVAAFTVAGIAEPQPAAVADRATIAAIPARTVTSRRAVMTAEPQSQLLRNETYG